MVIFQKVLWVLFKHLFILLCFPIWLMYCFTLHHCFDKISNSCTSHFSVNWGLFFPRSFLTCIQILTVFFLFWKKHFLSSVYHQFRNRDGFIVCVDACKFQFIFFCDLVYVTAGHMCFCLLPALHQSKSHLLQRVMFLFIDCHLCFCQLSSHNTHHTITVNKWQISLSAQGSSLLGWRWCRHFWQTGGTLVYYHYCQFFCSHTYPSTFRHTQDMWQMWQKDSS